ncbi:iron ABC transporter permease [Leifsonia sp. LS1]|uniref:FecCD family ABC transporter permease n=1 Tax=Leifsonia sp. LS1 TaxID=2828483 RepID=UPI001CFCB02D|nr:iron ABC transporter permease [Leifsonia sp. LS1]
MPLVPIPRRALVVFLSLSAALLVTLVLSLGTGAVPLSPGAVLSAIARGLLGGDTSGDVAAQVVWSARLPRILMAAVAGAGLAFAGAVLQALVRNSLADPYLLGLNSGASTGVAIVVLVVGSGTALAVSGAALVGAVLTVALVLALAGAGRARGPHRIVLAGLAVGYALSAVTSLLLFLSDSPEAARSVMFWLLGSLAAVQPTMIVAVAIAVALGLAGLVLISGRIDALASGDDSAIAAGLDPERSRFAILAGTSAVVGVIVAGVGGVGFIGLVVPHLGRALVGARHRRLLPASALIGAILLVAADTGARTLLAPHEIPVGVITGVIGAPVLLALLARGGNDRPRSAATSRPHSPAERPA